MATKKQQKRRRKRFVHGAPERAPQPTKARAREERPAKARSGRSRFAGQRQFPEPSLRRSIRRAGLVLISLVAIFYLLIDQGKHPFAAAVAQALPAALLFVPFDYFFGRFMYRRLASRAPKPAK